MEECGGVEGGAVSGVEGECRVGGVEGVEGLGGWGRRLKEGGKQVCLVDTRAGHFRWVLGRFRCDWRSYNCEIDGERISVAGLKRPKSFHCKNDACQYP